MQLEESEAYACAALFVLALYSLAIEAGAYRHGVGRTSGAWGLPLELIADAYIDQTTKRSSSGWGWSLISPQGVCGPMFNGLRIKPGACASILSLPDSIHPLEAQEQREAFCRLVEVFARHIDEDVTFVSHGPGAAILRVSDGCGVDDAAVNSPQSSSVADDEYLGDEGLKSCTDPIIDSQTEGLSEDDLEKREEEALREALMSLQDDPAAMERIHKQISNNDDNPLTEGAALPEPCFECSDHYTYKASSVSVRAISALVSSYLSTPEDPSCTDIEQSARWYDARVRVAALRVCHWLRVPMSNFRSIELRLFEDISSELKEVSDAQLRSYHSNRSKWLKVGAAAVGGGVLTAVTAGLAAPAIVAGVGALVGFTGAAAAIAGTATSVTSLSLVTGGSGAAGAAFYSSKMAKRSSDVTEFGFVRLSDWDAYIEEARVNNPPSPFPLPMSSNSKWMSSPSIDHMQQIDDSEVQVLSANTGASGKSPGQCSTPELPAVTASKKASQKSFKSASTVLSFDGKPGKQPSSQGAPKASQRTWGDWRREKFTFQKPGSSQSKKASAENQQAIPDPLAQPEPLPVMRPSSGDAMIVVNGWLAEREDFLSPFKSLPRHKGNTMSLVWESKELLEIRKAFAKLLARSAGQQVVQLALYATVSDSAWDVACLRAQCGGKLLANMLIAKLHGDRPVTLLGVSVGARLVYYCLLELYKLVGIVEHAILLGAPVSIDSAKIQAARSVVAGRFINGYCITDWLLGLCSRTKIGMSQFKAVAGLRPMKVPGVEDIDFTATVTSHSDWTKNMDSVLSMLHLSDETDCD